MGKNQDSPFREIAYIFNLSHCSAWELLQTNLGISRVSYKWILRLLTHKLKANYVTVYQEMQGRVSNKKIDFILSTVIKVCTISINNDKPQKQNTSVL